MSAKKEKRVCPICGNAFVAKSANQAYCSAACKREARAKREKAARTGAGNGAKKAAAKKPIAVKAPIKKTVVSAKVVKADGGTSPLAMMSVAFGLISDALTIVAQRAAGKGKGK